MRKIFFVFILLNIFIFSFAHEAYAVTPLFRRPVSITPTISGYYDNDSSSGTKNYKCGTSGIANGHKGTDFAVPTGTSVYATKAGGLYYRYDACPTVGYLGSSCGGGYGNHVKIDHEGNTNDGIGWVTLYAHLKQGTAAYTQCTLCNNQIGLSGSSGNSSGPHLHFEVMKYSYPLNDPFSGSCSHTGSFWVNQGSGMPSTQCQ
jgi:murein DD-endopeptidase MepM/ murein hydrolase activator NlpD